MVEQRGKNLIIMMTSGILGPPAPKCSFLLRAELYAVNKMNKTGGDYSSRNWGAKKMSWQGCRSSLTVKLLLQNSYCFIYVQ